MTIPGQAPTHNIKQTNKIPACENTRDRPRPRQDIRPNKRPVAYLLGQPMREVVFDATKKVGFISGVDIEASASGWSAAGKDDVIELLAREIWVPSIMGNLQHIIRCS